MMRDNKLPGKDTPALSRVLAAGTFWGGMIFSGLMLAAVMILAS